VTLRLTAASGFAQQVAFADGLTPADVHHAMASNRVGWHSLAGGGQVLVNWRTIATASRSTAPGQPPKERDDGFTESHQNVTFSAASWGNGSCVPHLG